MIYTCKYNSPIGTLTLASKENRLIGLYIKNFEIKEEFIEKEDELVLVKTKNWLDKYFNDEQPNINEIDIELTGSVFSKKVWKLLSEIPYGELTTYKELANKICKIMNKTKMSSQAIGNSVGKNPIPIILPCHRVIGQKGNLTGYSSGLEIKIELLKHENIDITKLTRPKERKNNGKNKM